MKSKLCLLAFAALLAVPLASFATPCPTDTLANVIALGSCTVGTTTITWSPPSFLGEYYNGPFAGDTGTGPFATQITFTPGNSSTSPGFSLSGTFKATGGFSCAYGSGLCGPYGNKYDEQLSYFTVTADTGEGITGISTGMQNASVSTDVNYNSVLSNLVLGASSAVYQQGDGSTHLSDHQSVAGSPNSLYGSIFMHTWNYSSDSNSVSSFDSVSFNWDIAPQATGVPEPSCLLLMASGVAGLLYRRKRN